MNTRMSSSGEAAQSVTSAVGVRRYVNDEISRIGERFDAEDATEFDFLCECGSLACRAVIKMTLGEYRERAPGSVVAHA